jgi:hypothetical protein
MKKIRSEVGQYGQPGLERRSHNGSDESESWEDCCKYD